METIWAKYSNVFFRFCEKPLGRNWHQNMAEIWSSVKIYNWAMKKTLGYIGDYPTLFFVGIIINHCKDPY